MKINPIVLDAYNKTRLAFKCCRCINLPGIQDSMNIKRERCPSHPGAILRELYMKPLKISVTQFAKDIGVSRKTISRIVNEKVSVTSDLAFRFSKAFPNSTFYSWVGLQKEYDNWHNTPRTCQFDAYQAGIEEGNGLWEKESL